MNDSNAAGADSKPRFASLALVGRLSPGHVCYFLGPYLIVFGVSSGGFSYGSDSETPPSRRSVLLQMAVLLFVVGVELVSTSSIDTACRDATTTWPVAPRSVGRSCRAHFLAGSNLAVPTSCTSGFFRSCCRCNRDRNGTSAIWSVEETISSAFGGFAEFARHLMRGEREIEGVAIDRQGVEISVTPARFWPSSVGSFTFLGLRILPRPA